MDALTIFLLFLLAPILIPIISFIVGIFGGMISYANRLEDQAAMERDRMREEEIRRAMEEKIREQAEIARIAEENVKAYTRQMMAEFAKGIIQMKRLGRDRELVILAQRLQRSGHTKEAELILEVLADNTI